jgi:hypothetical protein
MNWQIPVSTQCVIGVGIAVEIVHSRLAYIKEKGSQCNQRKLIDEALHHANLLRDWVRANQPVYEHQDKADRNGKPGPMSDG